MQKKIIALAVASALVAPAAFADTSNVNVYGVANVSYDLVTTKNTANTGVSTSKVSSNTSRLGLKGSEDLGDGLSAIWQVESTINIDQAGTAPAGNSASAAQGGAGNTLGNRNTFAGLSSATMGTVIMGRHDTPYNIATRKLDVFTDGLADNRSLMGGVGASTAGAATVKTAIGLNTTAAGLAGVAGGAGVSAAAGFDGRQPDVIAYISPAISGFTGAIAYLNLAETNNTSAALKASAWSMAGMYSQDAFYGSLAYEVHSLDAVLGAGKKESATKFGFGYTQDAIAVGFAYEKTNDNFGFGDVNALGHSAYYLSGKYSFGNDAVKAAYTNVGTLGGLVNTGVTQLSLGYDHSLSKRTTVYALYTALKSGTASAFGLSTNGTGGGSTGTGVGSAPSAVSFGMKHTF